MILGCQRFRSCKRLAAVLLLIGISVVGIACSTTAGSLRADEAVSLQVTKPPKTLELDPIYTKHVSATGFPVIGTDKVSDYALLEAGYLINLMLKDRPDVRNAMIRNNTRFVVMAYNEFTTDFPEQKEMKPKDYWDRRARGLGAIPRRPVSSCGEENLIQLKGDPYHAENILIHEFAHTIHHMGLNYVDKGFDKKLKEIYADAMGHGLWKGKYASTNRAEYWAEAVQSYFGTNRPPDHDHNHVDTREELKEYDPAAYELVAKVFHNADWNYVWPRDRKEKQHLEGLDPAKMPAFSWPKRLLKEDRKIEAHKKKLLEQQKKNATDNTSTQRKQVDEYYKLAAQASG